MKNKVKALKVLRARLLDVLKSQQDAKISQTRRTMIGSGDRSEKIRTYNFPQNRVTDHRIGLTLYNLGQIIDGDLDELIDGAKKYLLDNKMKIAEQSKERLEEVG